MSTSLIPTHPSAHPGEIRTQLCRRIPTRDAAGETNGFLVPVYNRHEPFFADGFAPQQVYLTVVAPGKIKGPHLHHIRRGFFTCIKGSVRFVLKQPDASYRCVLSGEGHGYVSVDVPPGTPLAIQNIGSEEAFVLNLPSPAWTPDMNDEHTADFSDFDFSQPAPAAC